MSEDIDFRAAMHDVRRLEKPARATTKTPPASKHANKRYARARINAALKENTNSTKHLGTESPSQTGCKQNERGATQLFFARPGLQNRQLKALARIQSFPASCVLDLHGHDQASAIEALDDFLASCQQIRCQQLLIIHGKGLRSASGAKLKTLTGDWLKQQNVVLAYTSAHQNAGGNGALAVLLRKPRRSTSR